MVLATADSMMPTMIAPDLRCGWCLDQMRELTLMGQSLVSPGHAANVAQQAIAGRLHEQKYHVHCNQTIGDRSHFSVAHLALPLLDTPTVVMYDREPRGRFQLGLATDRGVADRRMHWAEAVAESMKFARVGWRVIRIREAGLEPTGPLDVVLPRPVVGARAAAEGDAMLRIAVQHVVGIVDADVAAA